MQLNSKASLAHRAPLPVLENVNTAAGIPPVPCCAANQTQLDASRQVGHALDVHITAVQGQSSGVSMSSLRGYVHGQSLR